MIIAILNALVAIPKIADLVMNFASAIMAWYVQKQTNETLSEIADAAALAARAKNDDERFRAAELWRKALSRDKVS